MLRDELDETTGVSEEPYSIQCLHQEIQEHQQREPCCCLIWELRDRVSGAPEQKGISLETQILVDTLKLLRPSSYDLSDAKHKVSLTICLD